jgi:hypothetical protein
MPLLPSFKIKLIPTAVKNIGIMLKKNKYLFNTSLKVFAAMMCLNKKLKGINMATIYPKFNGMFPKSSANIT